MRVAGMSAIFALPSGATPTPIPIAICKSATVDFKQDKKILRGQWMGGIDAFAGPLDITLKLVNSDFSASMLSMVNQGATNAANGKLVVSGEAGTVPTTPFQITVSGGATFSEDGGVLDLTAGKWLTRGATATGAGVYAVAAGVYTFNTADSGHSVLITYTKTATSAVMVTQTMNNQVMGPSTGYLVRVFNNYTISGVAKSAGYEFPNVHFNSFGIGFKSEDWTEVNLEGKAIQDVTTNLLYKAYAD